MPSAARQLAGLTALIVVAAGCGSDATTGTSERASQASLIAAGPVPNPPGSPRQGAVVATVGDSIVVFGGVDEEGRGSPVAGGSILDGAGSWEPLQGDSGIRGGLILGGAVDTGDKLLILGTECDEVFEKFYLDNPDMEDELPCRGNPLRFIEVDPVTKSMHQLPAPDPALVVDRENVSSYSLFMRGVGWSKGRAAFNVGAGGGTTTLVYDGADQSWSVLPSPDPSNDGSGPISVSGTGPPVGLGPSVTVAGGEIVAVEPAAITRAWRWDGRDEWTELDPLTVPADASQLRIFGFRTGDVGLLTPRGNGGTASVFRLEPTTLRWEQLPETPPLAGSISDWTMRVGTSLISWVGPQHPEYLELADGASDWVGHAKPAGYRDDPWETAVYADRALLLVPNLVGPGGTAMELVYVQ